MKSITGDGSEGLRALNPEEKEWLNKFYGEYVNNSFKKDGSDLHVQTEDQLDILESLRADEKFYKGLIKKDDMTEMDWECYNEVLDQIYELDYRKNCSDRNNARNRCLYNDTKKRGKLTKRTMGELDQNTISKLEGFDLELALAVNCDWFNKD